MPKGAFMCTNGVLSLLACLALAVPSFSAAQPSVPIRLVTLEGIVVDDEKAPVPDAQLSLKPFGQITRSARSGNDGRFSFDGVPPGQGSITVKRLEYKPRTLPFAVTAANPSLEVAVEE